MNKILFVTNKENFQIFTEKGIVGFKVKRKKEAEKTHPGDLIACYIGGVGKIGGIVKIESDMYEETEKLFKEKTKGEIYPYRFKASNVVVLPEEKWIPVSEFHDKLEMFMKKAPHYNMALMGQVHYLTDEDFKIVEQEILLASTAELSED